MGIFDTIRNTFGAKHTDVRHESSDVSGNTDPVDLLSQSTIIPRPNTWMRPDVSFHELVTTYMRLPRLKSSIGRHIAGTVGNNHYFTADPPDEADSDEAEEVRKHLERIAYSMDLFALNRQIAADAWLTGNCIMTKPVFQGKHVIRPAVLPLSSFIYFYLDENMHISKYRYSTVALGSSALHNMAMQMQARAQGAVRNTYEFDADQVLHFSRGHENGLPWGSSVGQIIMRQGVEYTMPDGTKSRPASSAQQWAMVTDLLCKLLIAGVPRHIASYKDKEVDPQAVQNMGKWMANGKPLTHYATNGEVNVETVGLEMEQKYDAILDHINHTATSTLQDPTENMWTNSGLFSQASSKTIMESMLPHIIGYEYDHKRFIELNILKPIVEHYHGPDSWDKFGIELNWGIPTKPSMEDLTQFVNAWRQTPALQDVVKPQAVMEMYQKAGIEVEVMSDDEIEQNKQERMAMAQQMMQQTSKKKQDDDDMDDVDGDDDQQDDDSPAEARRQQARYHRLAADRLEGQQGNGSTD